MLGASILLAEKKKTVKVPVPKVLKEYTVKKNLKNHVEMRLKIKPKQVAGDPILLEITVTNRGRELVRHGPTDASYRDFRVNIIEPSEKEVPFTRFGEQRCRKIKPTEFTKFNPKPIKPGESYSVTFNLSLLFDLTLPGTYRAKVETEVYPLGSPKESTEFTLEVTGLEFKVSEPRPVIRVRGPAGCHASARRSLVPCFCFQKHGMSQCFVAGCHAHACVGM
jgi:hypothetical protein